MPTASSTWSWRTTAAATTTPSAYCWATAMAPSRRMWTTGLEVVIPSSVAVGDFNGDGRPDLVVADLFSMDNHSLAALFNSAGFRTRAAASDRFLWVWLSRLWSE